ncbi:MAG: glycosyltransferase [Methyloceanibacter sp.]
MIAIDDGSDDGIAAEIKARLRTHPCPCYLRHGHRAGQSAALRTGVRAARFPGHRHHGWRRPTRSGRYHESLRSSRRSRPRAGHGSRHQVEPEGVRLSPSGIAFGQFHP